MGQTKYIEVDTELNCDNYPLPVLMNRSIREVSIAGIPLMPHQYEMAEDGITFIITETDRDKSAGLKLRISHQWEPRN